ncbi:MAG: chlorite dismutase family protein [Candidatus Rokubacteria bacterium]|nr:chlorite dismutase family protein [Candidatus Rokubacteria bacterium]
MATGETTPPGRYFLYTFFKATPAYLQLPKEEKARAIADYLARMEEFRGPVTVRPYSTLGLRRDADFLLWLIARDLPAIQALCEGLRRSALAPYLENAHALLAVTRESTYVKEHQKAVPHEDLLASGTGQYLFVYPFVKTREWYLLPLEERQRMMNEHIRTGHEFPGIRINTSYSFGLDDQDFVVSFEGNEPKEFVSLVMRLRESGASRYTQRDTPIFTCAKRPLEEILWALG